LKAIGVVKDDKMDIYQDSVTAPLSREHNNDVGSDTEENMAAARNLGEVLTTIPKVCSWMSESFVRLKTNQCLYVSA
jgi:hypothetical protein